MSRKNKRPLSSESFGEFPVRFRAAFHNAKMAEIARQLGITGPAVKNYLIGRIPPAETLLQVQKLTGCSLHWLLTGEGPRESSQLVASGTVDNLQVIRVYLTQKLSELMEEEGSEEVIRYLIGELSRLTGHHEGQERKANARRQKQ